MSVIDPLWPIPHSHGLASGVLHSDFHTGADFELVREYADKMGVLLWHDAMKRMLFISSSGVAPVRDFIDRRRMLE